MFKNNENYKAVSIFRINKFYLNIQYILNILINYI